MDPDRPPLITTETRVRTSHRAVCSACPHWHGSWFDELWPAEKERDDHWKVIHPNLLVRKD